MARGSPSSPPTSPSTPTTSSDRNSIALLARSAAVRRGVNVIIFPGSCRADRLTVVGGGKLDKLGAGKRV